MSNPTDTTTSEPAMPRLFAAILIPEPIRLRLSLLGAPLRGAKWVAADDLHLTLRFAGDIDGRQADEFADALALIESPPLSLRIAALGAFGGREPKTVWAGLAPSPDLEQLQRLCDRSARQAGIAPDPHPYKAHVTLARLRGGNPHLVAAWLAQHGGFTLEPFAVTEFVLLSAKPGTGGGPYAVEERYPLSDRALRDR